MTQEEFAKTLSLTRRQVAEIEAGTANRRLKLWKRLVAFSDLKLDLWQNRRVEAGIQAGKTARKVATMAAHFMFWAKTQAGLRVRIRRWRATSRSLIICWM